MQIGAWYRYPQADLDLGRDGDLHRVLAQMWLYIQVVEMPLSKLKKTYPLLAITTWGNLPKTVYPMVPTFQSLRCCQSSNYLF